MSSQMKSFIVEYSIQGPAASSANQYVKTVVTAMNYDQARAMVEGMFNGTAHIWSVQEQR